MEKNITYEKTETGRQQMVIQYNIILGRDHEVVNEESEPEEFWNSIGGQGGYSKCSGKNLILQTENLSALSFTNK